MAKRMRLLKEIFVYKCDTLDDGTPVWAVAETVDQIPEDVSGDRVGFYVLKSSPTFAVHRTIKG